jgi:hypothetical protein
MKQSRLSSFMESVATVAIGYGVNFVANLLVLPAFGFPVRAGEAAAMGVVFTFIAIPRSYLVRRLFEALRK